MGGEPVGAADSPVRAGALGSPSATTFAPLAEIVGGVEGAGRDAVFSVHSEGGSATGGSSEDSVTIATPARQGQSTPSDASPPIKTIGLFHHARLARSVCSSNDARARINSSEGGLGVGGPWQPVGPTAAPPFSGIKSAPRALERQVVSRAAARWRPYAGAKLRACARQSSSISAGPASQTGPPSADVSADWAAKQYNSCSA